MSLWPWWVTPRHPHPWAMQPLMSLEQGSVRTELCASVAGLWRWAGALGCHRLGLHGSISLPLPHQEVGTTILVLGSLAGHLCVTSGEGFLRLWPLPWASPWSVCRVGPREGRVWAFWGVKLCSPSKYPKPDMWPHQRERERCCDRPAGVWATDMLPVSAWLPVTGKVALGGDYSPEGLPRKLGPQGQPGLGVLA